MRVLLVAHAGRIPYHTGRSGSPIFLWGLVHVFLEIRCELHLVICGVRGSNEHDEAAVEYLAARGVTILTLPSHPPELGSDIDPRIDKSKLHRLKRHIKETGWAPKFLALLDEMQPDFIYCSGVGAIAPFSVMLERPPVAVSLVNLKSEDLRSRSGLARVFSRGWLDELRLRGKNWLVHRGLQEATVEVLRSGSFIVEHAAHYVELLRAQGLARVFYLPNPVFDRAGTDWASLRERHRHGKPQGTILFIGMLSSTINQPALHLIADEILPLLEAQTEIPFILDIVGGGKDRLDASLLSKLKRSTVRFKGFVPDSTIEFASCDVLLVCTPEPLGFRTRIVEGFSCGCAVVSHAANAAGMEELQHGVNVLLGNSGKELAEHCLRLLGDPGLRGQLGRNGRKTFDERLSLPHHAKVVQSAIDETLLPRSSSAST